MLTKQEIFNRVCLHLLTMKQQAMVDDKCCYRSPHGPCAVGIFIPDDFYIPSIEGDGIRRIMFAGMLPGIRDEEAYFLSNLQGIHDNDENWDDDGLNEGGVADLYAMGQVENLNTKILECR